ncbi:hypothetical protein J6590_012664 [Homalodisca vitripennis]|nr:hypothetical protein J6590_012664 [Homalodisca vitripennis]
MNELIELWLDDDVIIVRGRMVAVSAAVDVRCHVGCRRHTLQHSLVPSIARWALSKWDVYHIGDGETAVVSGWMVDTVVAYLPTVGVGVMSLLVATLSNTH